MRNLTRCVLSCDTNWTAPAGVTQIRASSIPMSTSFQLNASGSSLGSTPNAVFAISEACGAYGWGSNCCGQLGQGTSQNSSCVPTVVTCGFNWRSISTSGTHTLGIDTNGNGYAWGNNGCGQIGNLTVTSTCVPTAISCIPKLKQVAAGISSQTSGTAWSLAITCAGDMYAWGLNQCGQLGNGSLTVACCPTLVCCGLKWMSIVATNGCGNTSWGIDTNGNGYGWGANTNGVIGNNSTTAACLPTLICCAFTWKALAGSGLNGAGITCAGDMYVWGSNTCGQLGNGSLTSSCKPVLACCGIKWKALALSNCGTTFGIDVQGNLYGWGNNLCGIIGNNSISPTCLPTLICCGFKWKAVAAMVNTAYGITSEGQLYSWGSNGAFVLGINCASTVSVCQPTLVCSGTFWGPTYPQNSKTYTVIPGTTYPVAIFGQFQSFEYDPINQDYATESIVLEYFQ